jgi:hypothetical protein
VPILTVAHGHNRYFLAVDAVSLLVNTKVKGVRFNVPLGHAENFQHLVAVVVDDLNRDLALRRRVER